MVLFSIWVKCLCGPGEMASRAGFVLVEDKSPCNLTAKNCLRFDRTHAKLRSARKLKDLDVRRLDFFWLNELLFHSLENLAT